MARKYEIAPTARPAAIVGTMPRADDGAELAWRTPRRHAAAVLDQVARQLALGHEPAPYNTIRE